MTNADWIRENGTTAKGKKEYVKYLKNAQKLTPKEAILANCYQCLGFYIDGKNDCEIPDCPLYPFMPYRKDAEAEKVKRARSEKQIEHDRNLSILRSRTKKTMSASK